MPLWILASQCDFVHEQSPWCLGSGRGVVDLEDNQHAKPILPANILRLQECN